MSNTGISSSENNTPAHLPRLTCTTARILLSDFMDTIKSLAKEELRHHAHTAGNGVVINSFYDLGYVLSDTEWAIFDAAQANAIAPNPANQNIGVPFVLRPAPKPLPVPAVPTALYFVERKEQQIYITDFHSCVRKFKAWILQSVDEEISELLKVNGSHQDVELYTIIGTLNSNFGVINGSDLLLLHNAYIFPFQFPPILSSQIATMAAAFAKISSKIPSESVSEQSKIGHFFSNIKSLPMEHQQEIERIAGFYTISVQPLLAAQSFNAMTKYIIEKFHPIMPTDQSSTSADFGLVHHSRIIHTLPQRSAASTAKSSLMYSQDDLDKAVATALSSSKNSSKTKPKPSTHESTGKISGDSHYCFIHGYNLSHPGSKCKVMQKLTNCIHEISATKPSTINGITSTSSGLTSDIRALFITSHST